MKKLIVLLAVVGFVPSAFGQGMEMTNNGSFRLIYQNDMNTDFNEDVDDGPTQTFSQRFRWGSMIKAGEKMNVNFTLAHAADWGSNPDQYPGAGQGNGENQENVLVVNELYMNWMISDEMMARVGRGSFTLADGTVVAANEWEQINKAFDGGMLTYDHEMTRLSLFGVRGANEESGSPNAYGNFFGLSADFKSLPEWLKMANLHYVMVKRDEGTYGGTANIPSENASRYGLTVAGDTAGVDYRATYAMYTGELENAAGTVDSDIDASMYDVEVGYSMPDMMNFRVSAGYHSDSGQDSSSDTTRYSGFHYDVHNNAGLMDVVGWGNLTYTRIGFTLSPAEEMTVGANYYMFTATEDDDDVNATDGTTAVAAIDGEDEVGSELDIWLTKRYTSNFSITARYGMFTAGDKISADGDDRNQVYLEGNLTF